MSEYTLFLDLAKEVQRPNKGILSRTLYNDDRIKACCLSLPKARNRPNTPP